MTDGEYGKSTPVILFGTGELPRTIRAYLDHASNGCFKVAAFTCDRDFIPQPAVFGGLPVLPFEKAALAGFAERQPVAVKLLLPVGYRDCNRLREKKYMQAKSWGFDFATYVHPSVQLFPDVAIGENSIVLDRVSLQPGAQIGPSCLLWSNAIIGHATTLGSCCWVSAGAVLAGLCRVGDRVFFGANSVVRDGITIGDDCIVGIGAIITRNTGAGTVFLPGVNRRFFKKSASVDI